MDQQTRDKFMRDLGRKAAYKEMGVWLRERPILAVVETLHRVMEEVDERWSKKEEPKTVQARTRRRTQRKS